MSDQRHPTSVLAIMEFTIDLATVRATLKDERRHAAADLTRGPLHAYLQSTLRHDQRLTAAPDAANLACKAGCAWCCHFTVDVRAVEAIAISQWIERQLAPVQRARIEQAARANNELLKTLDPAARARQNIQCPCLENDRCTIYPVRPQTCRNYHATDAAGCKQSFEQPENDAIDPDFAPLTYQLGGAHVEAFSSVLAQAGYDLSAYELNAALTAAFSDPQALAQRYLSKQIAWTDLPGEDVEPQFLDCDAD
jgi:Fe-S-cluster containining protein